MRTKSPNEYPPGPTTRAFTGEDTAGGQVPGAAAMLGALGSLGAAGQAAGGTTVLEDNPYAGTEISRNAPCPCGSGRKYKHCHGAAA